MEIEFFFFFMLLINFFDQVTRQHERTELHRFYEGGICFGN